MDVKQLFSLLIVTVTLYGCGSDEDSSDAFTNPVSSEIVSVSGDEIPAEADLAIVWIQPDDNDYEEYLTGGGRLSNGSFFVEPPDPIPDQVISETYGVATGFILAFRKGEAPAAGPYTQAQLDTNDYFDNAIGIVNKHAIIYRDHEPNPILFPDGTDWWGDRFDDGYSCARSISVLDDFDQFAPTDCSSMVLSFGILSEIEVDGGDWF